MPKSFAAENFFAASAIRFAGGRAQAGEWGVMHYLSHTVAWRKRTARVCDR